MGGDLKRSAADVLDYGPVWVVGWFRTDGDCRVAAQDVWECACEVAEHNLEGGAEALSGQHVRLGVAALDPPCSAEDPELIGADGAHVSERLRVELISDELGELRLRPVDFFARGLRDLG